MNKERITGLLLSLTGIVLVFLTSRIETSHASGEAGPRLFPYISAALLIIFGLIIFIRNSGSNKPFFTTTGWKKIAAMSGFLVFYPLELIYFGFIPAAFITTFGLTSVFGINRGVSLKNKLLFTVISTVLVFLIFRYLLNILLPQGQLIDFLIGLLWN